MTHDEAKQLMKIMAEELNVKRVSFPILAINNHDLEVIYENDELYLLLNDERILSARLNSMIPLFVHKVLASV